MGHQPQGLLAHGPFEVELLLRWEAVVLVNDVEDVHPGAPALGEQGHQPFLKGGVGEVVVAEGSEGASVLGHLVQLVGGGQHPAQIEAGPAKALGIGEGQQLQRCLG